MKKLLNIRYDIPNDISGMVYPKDELEKAVSKYLTKPIATRLVGGDTDQGKFDLSLACGVVEDIVFLEDHNIEVDIILYDNTPYGSVINSLETDNFRLSVVMKGNVNKDRTLTNLEICHFYLII